MAFDMNNQDIMALLQQLQGQQNPLGQPPLQQMETPPNPYAGNDINPLSQFQDAQALNPVQTAQLSFSQEPQQQLGQNQPQDFGGTGLGKLAPQPPQRGSGNLLDLMQLLQLSQQGIGGF